jgi:phosphohistidine phosphatase
MNFYLMRHGEAKSAAEDPSRPLSERGRRHVEQVARSARRRGVEVAEIWHSEKRRARETAELVARALAEPPLREVAGLGPDEDPEEARAELERMARPVMIVGHLPHLGRLLSLLVTGDPDQERYEWPAAALVCVAREGGRWKQQWMIAPEPPAQG